MIIMNHIKTLTLCLFVTSCANMFENRTFIDQMDHETDSVFVPGRDFQAIAGDSGNPYRSRDEIMERTPMHGASLEEQRQNNSLYQELYRKEISLHPKEKKLYSEVEPYLNEVSEKIYFLNLSYHEKMDFIEANNLPVAGLGREYNRSASRSIAGLNPRGMNEKSLYLGMSKDEVMNLWGRPTRIEVAGNPLHQNERWAFYDNGQLKYVYFEGGNVQGWEQR